MKTNKRHTKGEPFIRFFYPVIQKNKINSFTEADI